MKALEAVTRDGYAIIPVEQERQLKLKLSGTFEMTAANTLQHYLEQVHEQARKQRALELVVDISEVYYLGSSCIKSFVTLTVGLQNGTAGMLLRILTNPRLDWQERALSILIRLAPDRVIVEPSA